MYSSNLAHDIAHQTIDSNSETPVYEILLLEDSDVDTQAMVRALAQSGVKARLSAVASIAAFRETVERQRFDVTFLDFRLPDGTGLDALDILQTSAFNAATVPVMIVGEGRTDVAVQAMKQGCADYLIKSELGPDALGALMPDILTRRRLIARNWATAQPGGLTYSSQGPRGQTDTGSGSESPTDEPQEIGSKLAYLFEDDGFPAHFDFKT